MTITAKIETTCPNCLQIIRPGMRVNWERGQKATHVECPKGAALAVKVLAQEASVRAINITALCDSLSEANGGLTISTEARTILTEALDVIEDELFRQCERQAPKAPASPQASARLAGLAQLPKGIYRVSLDGTEKRYGVTHVNVQLVPGRDGNVKVGEWQGERVGKVGADGELFYWRESREWGLPAVNPQNPRVQAVVAALDIILGAADPVEFAKAYAVASSTCWRCGADLVDEKSRERLLGPDCYRQTMKGA